MDREKHVEAVNAAVRNVDGAEESDTSSNDLSAQSEKREDKKDVDHEDEYLDDDRHTVVTVEAVDISHDGLQRRQADLGSEDEEKQTSRRTTNERRNADGMMTKGSRTGSGKQRQEPDSRPKKKKSKFRYESKAERKVTRFRERSDGKAKARARRE